MLISIHMKKNFIYILSFMTINFIFMIIEKHYFNNNLSYKFIDFIGDTCLIVFYLFERHLVNKNNNNDTNIDSIQIISFKTIMLITFSIILNFISELKILYDNKENEIYVLASIILFSMLIEIIILKKEFYSHQIISLNIFIILYVYIFYQQFKLFYILDILQYYSYSLSLNLIKYINTKYFINIYLLASIHGIGLLIPFLIQNYKSLIHIFNISQILIKILYFLIYLINNFLRYKIIEKLGVIHSFISDFISSFILSIILEEGFNNFFYIGIGVISIISCFIYLEILELNFCGLDKNTCNNIIKRGEKEVFYQSISLNYT